MLVFPVPKNEERALIPPTVLLVVLSPPYLLDQAARRPYPIQSPLPQCEIQILQKQWVFVNVLKVPLEEDGLRHLPGRWQMRIWQSWGKLTTERENAAGMTSSVVSEKLVLLSKHDRKSPGKPAFSLSRFTGPL